MKRASYRKAVDWIAQNDEPTDANPVTIGELISTTLVAEIFGVSTERVAADILRHRKDIAKFERRMAETGHV